MGDYSGKRIVEAERNQELAKLIGRRLREACSCAIENELPGQIAGSLAVLREEEASRMAILEGSGSDNVPPTEAGDRSR